MALGERRCFGNGHGFGGAGGDSLSRQAIGGSKSPRSLRDHANSDAERFRFGERADLAVFCGEIAVANVHDARIGVSRAAQLRGFKRPVGEVLHHGFMICNTKKVSDVTEDQRRTKKILCAFGPRRQIQLLLGRELIHLHAHRLELSSWRSDASLPPPPLGRLTTTEHAWLRRCKIDQAGLPDKINPRRP